ncbi:MAG: clostripain-related cysteine peptidase [Balneolaceae bacterium]|nr:clostripain-related cysteine peptidase [Balneolaceae bacterium]
MYQALRLFPAMFMASAIIICYGCGSTTAVNKSSPTTGADRVEYTLVYIIHGDGDYLYHDAEGRPQRADKKVLKEALQVGANAQSGEVYIFHLRPERRILGLLPRKDRRFIYYRYGEMIHDTRYSPGKTLFASERQLFHSRHDSNRTRREDKRKVLLFFGHQIPATGGDTYHRTYHKTAVNIQTFSESLASFLYAGQDAFDLLVLSTCNNGTPAMASALTSTAQYLLASPQDLHLSHIDTGALQLLEKTPETDGKSLGEALGQATYDRLSSSIYTAITLSLYDLKKKDLHAHKADMVRPSETDRDNVDCADTQGFSENTLSDPISTWYRPALFGKKQGKIFHSGWGCPQTESVSP